MRSIREVSLKPSDRAAIDEAVAIIRDAATVKEIWLFGSKARGDDDPESDIDLLVLTAGLLAPEARRILSRKLMDVEMRRDVVFGTLYIPFDEWMYGMMQVHPLKAEVEAHGAVA